MSVVIPSNWLTQKLRRWIFLLLAVCTLFKVTGQSTDSLLGQLEFVTGPKKVELFLELSRHSVPENLEKSIMYARQALELARSIDDEKGITASLDRLSSSYRLNNDLSRALPYQLELLRLQRQYEDKRGEASALHSIGNMYKDLGDHARALDFLLNALRIYEKLDDNYRKALAMHSIARLYESQHRDSLAQHAYHQSLHWLQNEENPDYSRLAIVATSFGGYFEEIGQFDSALIYYKRALDFSRQITSPYNTHAITMALLGISSLYESEEAHYKALEYNRQALDLAVEIDNPMLLALTHKNHANILRNGGKLRESNHYYQLADSLFQLVKGNKERIYVLNAQAKNYFELGNHQRAEASANEAWQLIRESGPLDLAEKTLPLLIRIYQDSEQYDKAFQYQQTYQEVRDSLLNEKSANQIAKLRALYETEKKEKEIMLLRKNAQRSQILLWILAGGTIAVLVITFLLFRQQRLKRKKDRIEYDLQQHRLQSALQVKQQQLTTYTLKFVQKNRLLEQLREKISFARKEAGNNSGPVLNELDRSIRSSFRLDEEWKEFQHYFENVHPRFFNTLKEKHPNLSNKDLRLCALLKLNLSSKEMATILGISPNSVKMARHRLRKKLDLDGNEDLVTFMLDIDHSASFQSQVNR